MLKDNVLIYIHTKPDFADNELVRNKIGLKWSHGISESVWIIKQSNETKENIPETCK